MTITIDPIRAAVSGGTALPRLQVVVRGPRPERETDAAREREVELTIHQAGATVADLALALGLPATAPDGGSNLAIDGRFPAAGLPLRATGVRRGSLITVSEGNGASGGETPGETCGPPLLGMGAVDPAVDCSGLDRVVLRTLAGPDAGREVVVGPGSHVVGRGGDVDIRLDDPGLARRQAVLAVAVRGEVSVTDLSAPRPSRIDGVVLDGVTPLSVGQVLAMGSTLIAMAPEVVQVDGADRGPASAKGRPGSAPAMGPPPIGSTLIDWTRPLHRPPRPPIAPSLPPVAIPSLAPSPSGPVPLGIAMVVTTLIASCVVALVVHQPAFVLLGAVGAVGTLGAGLWQRGRSGSRRKAERGRDRDALSRLAADLAAHQAAVATRRRSDTMELADAVACARTGGSELWARRAQDPDAYRAVIGRGEQMVRPTLAGDGARVADEAWALVEAAGLLTDVPVTVDLGAGAVVGVVGPHALAEAVARSLVLQLVVAHGPADLIVGGLFAPLTPPQEPSWLRWLPHACAPSGGESLIAVGPEVAVALAALDRAAWAEGGRPGPHVLLVVHDPALLGARNTATRQLLASDPSTAALIVADDPAALPSICHTVVEVRVDGTAAIHRPGHAELAEQVAIAGASAVTAREVALALAGRRDPEQPAGGACVPAVASLADLLGAVVRDPAAMRSGWKAGGDDPPLSTLLAVAADGPVEVDLVRDGPHALIAGTTGSGKSELLRTLVAGLAARSGPDLLAFVLVDYKGGAAFDACAELPHVVGLVTDLDERLAERALRSLHAELRRRERILREAGAADLTAYRAISGRPALARLVVVVDEFATLATDLPGFVASLVGVAQRGRSLGVHLILATQRPSGAVSDDIRANTNLRIALRVQDPADSLDVVGDAVAASFPRHRPGRAVVRFGPGELVPVQVAAISRAEPAAAGLVITVEPIGDAPPLAGGSAGPGAPGQPGQPPDPSIGAAGAGGSPTVLEALVATARAAAAELDEVRHRPWLPSLPDEIPWDELAPGAAGMVDDPDHQSQEPWIWEPNGAHLLCLGTVGTGATSALTSLTLAAAAVHPPAALHVYVLHGGSSLSGLAELPHVGASIGPDEDERQARLLRRLAAMLQRDVADLGGPRVLLVVDRLGVWRHSVAERLGPELADLLDRILVEGPAAGIVVAGGLDRPGGLPLAVSGAVGERIVLRLADPADAVTAGVRPNAVAGLPRGRGVLASCGLTVQLARTSDLPGAVRSVAARWAGADRVGRASAVLRLPTSITASDLTVASDLAVADGGRTEAKNGSAAWTVVIGTGDAALEPVSLAMHPGDHFLIAGPARSGRSSALVLLAELLRRADPSARVLALTPRHSPLDASPDVEAVCVSTDDLEGLVRPPGVRPDASPTVVVLVDDAEMVDDPSEGLARLLAGSTGPVNVIAAGRVDGLRAAYGHWTQMLRRQRRGLILRPEADLDGDVLGVLLPRWESTPPAPGRGYLVADGECTLVQLARTDPSRAARPG